MSIAPIVKSVTVKVPPARAFDIFAGQMERWWPAGRTVGKNPHVAIVLEPQPDGRWYERDAQGHETQWGKVLDWAPPERLLLGWQLSSQFSYESDLVTEVELTFTPTGDGGTLVTLEHRNLERYGADAEKVAAMLGGGWPGFLADFATLANT